MRNTPECTRKIGSHPPVSSANVEERTLVDAARSGQQWAFAELCDRHSKRIFNVIYRVTKNREDAEDALQDCMMKAYLHLNQFDGRSSFSTWMTRIGINSALMVLRKKRSYREIPMEMTFDGGETWHSYDATDASPSPEQRYTAREEKLRLHSAVNCLPPSLRCVVEMRQADDLSMKEIAEAIGISVPAAKSRFLRAKNSLRGLTDNRPTPFTRNITYTIPS